MDAHESAERIAEVFADFQSYFSKEQDLREVFQVVKWSISLNFLLTQALSLELALNFRSMDYHCHNPQFSELEWTQNQWLVAMMDYRQDQIKLGRLKLFAL